MPKFTIDKVEFNTEDLSDQGRKVFESLQFVMIQLQKVENELDVYKIAYATLTEKLRSELAHLK